MDKLEEIRQLALKILYLVEELKAPLPQDPKKEAKDPFQLFSSSVNRALEKIGQEPYSTEELQELYDLSEKDPVLVGKVIFRSSRKNGDLKPYVLNVFRKYGASGVRGWFETKTAPESPSKAVEKIVAQVGGSDDQGV